MTDITIHEDDTIALTASLPRDLTGASVDLLVGGDERPVSAAVDSAADGDVSVPLSTADFDVGANEIKFRITFGDGTVEVLPPEGDHVYVYG
jgi:hypothetical protein